MKITFIHIHPKLILIKNKSCFSNILVTKSSFVLQFTSAINFNNKDSTENNETNNCTAFDTLIMVIFNEPTKNTNCHL